jgi:hypothetical protein
LVKGEGEVEKLTDAARPRRLGPKRANNIRKAFALRKQDNVTKYIVRREIKRNDKTFYKSPSVQRLITEKRVRRKTVYKKVKKDRWKAGKEAHVAYEKLLSKYLKEKKAAKKAETTTAEPVVAAKPTPAKPVKAAKAPVAAAKPAAAAKPSAKTAKAAKPAKK